MQKTVGLAEPLRQALESFQAKINAAFMYGSVAEKGDTAHIDIDLVVLSDERTYGDVSLALRDAGHTLGQEVNPTIPARAEYRGQIAARESFRRRDLEQRVVWIVGGKGDIVV